MDSLLSTLGFVIFGITFGIYSVIAESQSPSTSVSRLAPSPLRPPLPRPRPPYSPSPPPYRPRLPPPTQPPSPRPPHSPPPPRHVSRPHNAADADGGPTPKRSPPNRGRSRHMSPPPASSPRMNWRKKVGLLFAGIAGIMQIGVVGFLVFKRRQLLRTKDAFEARG